MIGFDFQGLWRFVVKVGLCLLGALGGLILVGIAWLPMLLLPGWIGAGLSLLLLVTAALLVHFMTFERKDQQDQGQESQEEQGQDRKWRTSSPGIKSDEKYDMAYRWAKLWGKTKAEAWEWYCERTNIDKRNKEAKRAFYVAMGRRDDGEVKSCPPVT